MTDKDKAIIDTLQIDNEGLKEVKVLDIEKLRELGINDHYSFLSGFLDALNEKDFNDSTEDYIRGYKYGKTGTF